MWLWRRMVKISWTAKVSNSEVLSRVMDDRCIVNMIKQRKRKWLGHVLRYDVYWETYWKAECWENIPEEERDYNWWVTYYEGTCYKSVKKQAEDRCLWRVLEMEVWSNSEVLSRVMEDRCIVNTIKQRKRKRLGHVLRHDVLLRDVLEGRMLDKCTRGRKRPQQLMSSICYEGTSYKSVKKRAEDRCLWRVLEMEVTDLLYSSTPEEEEDALQTKPKTPSFQIGSQWNFAGLFYK